MSPEQYPLFYCIFCVKFIHLIKIIIFIMHEKIKYSCCISIDTRTDDTDKSGKKLKSLIEADFQFNK